MISELSSKYKFSEIHTADITDGKVVKEGIFGEIELGVICIKKLVQGVMY